MNVTIERPGKGWKAFCRTCGAYLHVDRVHSMQILTCPQCQSSEVQIIGGAQ